MFGICCTSAKSNITVIIKVANFGFVIEDFSVIEHIKCQVFAVKHLSSVAFVGVFNHEDVWQVHTLTGASDCLGCLSAYYLAGNKRRPGLTAGWSAATAAPLSSLPVREAGRGSEVVPWRGLRNWGGQ